MRGVKRSVYKAYKNMIMGREATYLPVEIDGDGYFRVCTDCVNDKKHGYLPVFSAIYIEHILVPNQDDIFEETCKLSFLGYNPDGGGFRTEKELLLEEIEFEKILNQLNSGVILASFYNYLDKRAVKLEEPKKKDRSHLKFFTYTSE